VSDTPLDRRVLGWAAEVRPIDPTYGYAHGVDVVLQDAGHGIDLARVDGVAALTQSLSVALTTGRGTDVFNTAFGWDGVNVLVRDPGDGLLDHRLTIATINTLKADPRVRTVDDVNVSRGGPETEQEMRDRSHRVIAATFSTVTGATTVIDLRGIVNA
jgi:hypothetical protein